MGLDDVTVKPGMLYVMDQSGRTAMETSVYDMQCDIPFSADAEPDYTFEFRTPLAQSFIGNSWFVDTNLLQHISEQPKGFYLEYETEALVQARKHRKKRINKKWLKRYGYKTARCKIRMDCEEMSISDDGDTISFDVKGVKV